MAREIIRPKEGTPPKAPLSPAVKAGNLVFVSGTPAFYGDRQIAKGDFPAQMHHENQKGTDPFENPGCLRSRRAILKCPSGLSTIRRMCWMYAPRRPRSGHSRGWR